MFFFIWRHQLFLSLHLNILTAIRKYMAGKECLGWEKIIAGQYKKKSMFVNKYNFLKII